MNKLSTIIFIIVAIIASTNAAVVRDAPDGITVTVDDINTFCSFLPRTPGEGIGASEGDAVAFCTQNTSKAPGARIFPYGFLKTAVFVDTGSYVQVTGTINPEAYSLSRGDGGGQYDSVGAPPNAQCAGYEKFVNLVEPDLGTFCIRCCHDPKDCDTGHSTAGCASIIPPPS